ncbi:uncharacterized protein LOC143148688 [Ptiloglossa arizonensis]|uniref:uncharacterized protein LOC143148688 n=1 Tax=Ptiloglossa arizonensis TaxID=3350558 RepID=UPI003F9ECC4D
MYIYLLSHRGSSRIRRRGFNFPPRFRANARERGFGQRTRRGIEIREAVRDVRRGCAASWTQLDVSARTGKNNDENDHDDDDDDDDDDDENDNDDDDVVVVDERSHGLGREASPRSQATRMQPREFVREGHVTAIVTAI